MCKPGPHFKFCTCDPENLGENYWRLNRGSSVEPYLIVGSIGEPYEGGSFDREQFIAERIIFDINNNPVFDFDYNPTEGDTFELQMLGDVVDSDGEREGNIWVELIYKNGQFSPLEELNLASRQDGEDLKSGYVSFKPEEEEDEDEDEDEDESYNPIKKLLSFIIAPIASVLNK